MAKSDLLNSAARFENAQGGSARSREHLSEGSSVGGLPPTLPDLTLEQRLLYDRDRTPMGPSRYERFQSERKVGPPEERFFSEREAAVFLGVSVRSLQSWRQHGCGPRFRRHGRSIRYALSDLLAWSESTAATSTSAVTE